MALGRKPVVGKLLAPGFVSEAYFLKVRTIGSTIR